MREQSHTSSTLSRSAQAIVKNVVRHQQGDPMRLSTLFNQCGDKGSRIYVECIKHIYKITHVYILYMYNKNKYSSEEVYEKKVFEDRQ